MPSFETPEPIVATLELDSATVRVTAGKRTETVVEVLPRNGSDDKDVRSVQETEVTCSGGVLSVKTPKKRTPWNKPGAIEVSIELPAGSEVRGTTGMGHIYCEGRLGDVTLRTGLGDLLVDEAAGTALRTGTGEIRLTRSTGDIDVTGAGPVEIGAVDGAATVKNVNGSTRIGEVTGPLKANASNGDITVGVAYSSVGVKSANGRTEVGVAHAGVDAAASNGGIRVGDAIRGRIDLRTSVGDLEVGIHEGTAAWLDLDPKYGAVRNSLGSATGPEDADETVEVYARSSTGDIIIRRA
ncbi:DUF4097 family beta strand repeat-containing protein [Streptomyces daliensis]|uniref:DUF4097 family beta strand repeat protein n=1 Tax=Streptomyces daliensis TaxID=299421 RepID=A0A8T4J2F7_9ACTN|nr:DUF4097 family beta strand repeat protein [Streptomyces daliensis]